MVAHLDLHRARIGSCRATGRQGVSLIVVAAASSSRTRRLVPCVAASAPEALRGSLRARSRSWFSAVVRLPRPPLFPVAPGSSHSERPQCLCDLATKARDDPRSDRWACLARRPYQRRATRPGRQEACEFATSPSRLAQAPPRSPPGRGAASSTFLRDSRAHHDLLDHARECRPAEAPERWLLRTRAVD